ncbi:hypothetical protein U9M48_014085 [Paspalum notatum var. saurae]|uniref:Reverse transcriptase zinc-binding domain-containing protein n=1 Tax=Paspalum notatum var. saurae TaxID=547442 RepID=A0AAQ3T0U6_PASNO
MAEGTWQPMLCNKYLRSKPLSQVHWKNGDSYFWASLVKDKQDFLQFGSFIIRDGSQIRFYEDRGVILTNDNLAKHNWQGSKQCSFCHSDETIKHLFFEYYFASEV